MARPFEKFPTGAKTHLEGMARTGLLSESAAAVSLGMPLSEFRRVIKEHGPSREIWETSLAIERDQLFAALYDKAVNGGDSKAASTLLAVRHGLSEKQPQGAGDRVCVVFNLPSALSPEEYQKAISVKQEAIGHDG
ncbi:MAG: hypothetical protein BWK76_09685 [Desulfobulbaceae bacterium A2]|nr:MAG: hypothetical protein BWK76_09685 [Desulfobulbaceae bacterium A2]